MKVLFIGNSHTYFNDMPQLFMKVAKEHGASCEAVMISHGGWFLDQHVKEPDVRFNIKFGHYDFVVLQEHAHPFGPVERMFDAIRTLAGWIHEAGSTPVLYMTWAPKAAPEGQAEMSKAYEDIALETKSLVAPVGIEWWKAIAAHPEVDLYFKDGCHASVAGSQLAAEVIWDTVCKALKK